MATLQETTDAEKLKVLQIGAQGGDDAVKAYQTAKAEIAAQQAAALAGSSQDAGLIGMSGTLGDTNALVVRPTAQLQGIISGDQARFTQARGLEQQGSLDYLTKLGALGPMIDQIAAARAAAAAGSGGGGGGGGGGSKKEPELSDSELRVRLTGAAENLRAQNTQDARAALVTARKPARQTRKQLQQVNRAIRRARNPEIAEGLHVRKVLRPLKDRRHDLRQELAREKSTARDAYATAARTLHTPLGPLATKLGVDADIDPNLAAGLFTPTQQQSLNAADKKALIAAGGVEAVLGHIPRQTRFATAKELNLPPAKIHAVRQSPSYREAAALMRDQLAAGADYRTLAMQLPKGTTGTGKKKRRRFSDSVVQVVLRDFAPAFAQ